MERICRQKNLSRFCLREAEQQNRGSSIAKLSGKSSPEVEHLAFTTGHTFRFRFKARRAPHKSLRDNERASAGLAVKFMEKSNAENNIEIFSKEVISANITILGYYHI